jgi:transposase
MDYIRGQDRSQTQLLPPSLEDYLPTDCPARFIDAYVEGLDFPKLGFTHAQPASTGRPAYHPADLLKLYLYGYLNRIRSSRRLEAEAGRNLELIWLLRGLRPDFKTIADFRKDNRAAFLPLFQQFNLLCRQMGLFGAELVAIDGSKFKAVNSLRRYYTRKKLAQLLENIQARIQEHLQQMDQQDAQTQVAAPRPTRQQLEQKLDQLRQRKGRYDQLLQELTETKADVVALTDRDARNMKGPHGGYLVGYNVQAAVDAKHDLIVAQAITTDTTDHQQLAPMAQAAKEQLAVPTLRVTADRGYHHTAQLKTCQLAGVETFVPKAAVEPRPGKMYPKSTFAYDATTDTYRCPQGQILRPTERAKRKAKDQFYYYNLPACAACAFRSQCTAQAYRYIVRQVDEAVMDANYQRVQAHPEIVAQRKTIVEHVFGTLRLWGHDNFLMRGRQKVAAEFSLSALVYNLRRVLNIVRIEELLKTVNAS